MTKSANKEAIILISVTAGFFFFSFFALIFFWQQTILLTAILFFLSLVELLAVGSKKLVIIFIVSGLGGAAIEIISIYFGIWAYNIKSFWGIPMWLFPLWGNAGIFIVTIYKLLSRLGWFERSAK